jgi:hypothetical protein
VKYWMRYWYRRWEQGQKKEADREEEAAELASGREQMPPSLARWVLRGLTATAGRSARSGAARRLQAILGNRGLLGLSGGRPLPAATRDRLERSLGVDLSAVRLHHDPAAAQAADAQAFAVGHDIVLGRAGDAGNVPLLGHEAAHVVQADAHPSRSGMSKPGGASEQEARQVAQAVQAGSPASLSQDGGAVPALQRQAGGGGSAPTGGLVRREAVRIMLFMQYQQQGGQGALSLTPALQSELLRLIPTLTTAHIAALWMPEPAGPMDAFQRLVDRGHLPLFTAPVEPDVPLTPEPEPERQPEARPSVRTSFFGPGGPGFHVTINPRAPTPASATIRQHLASRGIPFSYREVQALLAGREQGIEQIDQILRNIAPGLGREDRIQLARTIADTLLNRSIQGQLQREMPSALEEELRRQGQMEQVLGVPSRAQGSMPELLRLIPAGVSLTIYF